MMTIERGWHTDANDPHTTRFWSGTDWIAERVWDGTEWVDAPAPAVPVAPAPPVTPTAPTPPVATTAAQISTLVDAARELRLRAPAGAFLLGGSLAATFLATFLPVYQASAMGLSQSEGMNGVAKIVVMVLVGLTAWAVWPAFRGTISYLRLGIATLPAGALTLYFVWGLLRISNLADENPGVDVHAASGTFLWGLGVGVLWAGLVATAVALSKRSVDA